MTTRIKHILLVLLLVSGVMGCAPAYGHHYYGSDWYGSPYYYYSPGWYSYGPYAGYWGQHHHHPNFFLFSFS